MHAIIEIIKQLRGGLERFKDEPITLKINGYMPLHIEYIGEGPDNLPAIAVSHTYEQNGDLMRDPEICFQWVDLPGVGEKPPRTVLTPYSYKQDGLGLYKEYRYRANVAEVFVDTQGVKSAERFCRLWNRNLRQQGFLAEAERIAKAEKEKGGEIREDGLGATPGISPDPKPQGKEITGWPARVETSRTILVRDTVITDPGQAAEIYRDLKNLDREKMVVIALDEKNKILGSEIVSVGTLNYNLVHPRETFKVPLLLGAKQIITIHNHPSGCLESSDEDLSLDKRLSKGARLVGMELKHSLIIAGDNWSEYGQNTRRGQINTAPITGRKRIKEFEVRLENTRTGAAVLKPRDAVDVLAELVKEQIEKTHILYMDTRNQVIKINTVDEVTTKDVIREAIINSAAAFIVCGDTPLEETQIRMLSQAGKLVGIEMMDHVHTNLKDKDFVKSWKQAGLMEPAADYCKDLLIIKNTHLIKEVKGLPDLTKRYEAAMQNLSQELSNVSLALSDKKKIADVLNSPEGAELIARDGNNVEETFKTAMQKSLENERDKWHRRWRGAVEMENAPDA